MFTCTESSETPGERVLNASWKMYQWDWKERSYFRIIRCVSHLCVWSDSCNCIKRASISLAFWSKPCHKGFLCANILSLSINFLDLSHFVCPSPLKPTQTAFSQSLHVNIPHVHDKLKQAIYDIACLLYQDFSSVYFSSGIFRRWSNVFILNLFSCVVAVLADNHFKGAFNMSLFTLCPLIPVLLFWALFISLFTQMHGM